MAEVYKPSDDELSYDLGTLTIREIAVKYGVAPSTIIDWVKESEEREHGENSNN
jgi:transposase